MAERGATRVRPHPAGRSDRQVTAVTSAYQSREAELDARKKRYLWAMGSRVVLTGVSVSVFMHHPWVLYPSMAVSMILPYFAVVLANGGRKKPEKTEAYIPEPEPLTALPPSTPSLRTSRTIDAD